MLQWSQSRDNKERHNLSYINVSVNAKENLDCTKNISSASVSSNHRHSLSEHLRRHYVNDGTM